MKTFRQVGAGLLAFGLTAAGFVMSAPAVSAHTATLRTSVVCQDDGTYRVTYSGETTGVPDSGPGHVATLKVGGILPTGTTVDDAPATVTGNTTYGFTQVVPGDTTEIAAIAHLEWGDGAKDSPKGHRLLDGDCTPKTPDCVTDINRGQLDAHYVTDDFHAVVQYTGNKPLCDNASITVSLNSYQTEGPTWPTSGTQTFVDHDQVTIDKDHPSGNLAVTAPSCYYQTDLYLGSKKYDGVDGALPHYPDVVTPNDLIAARNGGSGCHQPTPSGKLVTDCVDDMGHVAATVLDDAGLPDVHWRLVTGTDASHTTVIATQDQSGNLEASGLADSTKVWLQYDKGNGWVDEGSTKTTGNCSPAHVPPSGSFTVTCDETGAVVTIGDLDNGTRRNVEWTLTVNGGQPQVVHSGDVITVPALATLVLAWNAGSSQGTAQTGTAPDKCPPGGTVDKTSDPASGSVVSPGQTVTYTVKVTNTGSVAFADKPAVDTLPDHVTLVPGSISGSGTASADGRQITWLVSLDPGDSATYTYQVTVDADAPARATLLNRVVFLDQEATTTHEVGERSLAIVKSVDPTGDAEFGDTLTYSLKVTAGGNLGQTDVVVTDYVPGYNPARDESGTTTYVDGSAACDAGPCTTSYDDSAKQVTWELGDMAPGTTRTVTFQVTIDTPAAGSDGSIPAVTIYNSAAVSSHETPETPSNEVVTPVTEVLGVKLHHPGPPEVQGGTLPHTGAGPVVGWSLGAGALFLLVGLTLVVAGRELAPRRVARHRAAG